MRGEWVRGEWVRGDRVRWCSSRPFRARAVMRVLLLGATGGIGARVLPGLLVAGHTVTTLSRRPGAVTAGPATRPLVGDITDPGVVSEAAADQDAVISALGVASLQPDETVAVGTANLVTAMAAAGVTRLIAVTGNGLGNNGGPIVDRVLTPTLLRHVKADAQAQEDVITGSSLDWTVVRPFRLVNAWPPSVAYRVAPIFSRTWIARWSTRDDVARCLLDQIHDGRFHQQIVWVASGGR